MAVTDLAVFYPDFLSDRTLPLHAGECGFVGSIQPFESDGSARIISRHLAADLPVGVQRGRLSLSDSTERPPALSFESRLQRMDIKFQVVLISRPAPKQSLTFVLDPEISRRAHPTAVHLRPDLSRVLDGKRVDALCLFAANDFEYASEYSREKQILDQTAIYLAKHVVWMRTRTNRPPGSPSVLGQQAPPYPAISNWRMPVIDLPRVNPGIWLGTAATGRAEEHLKVPPNKECWCGEGKRYGDCCRGKDLARRRAG